MPNTSAARFTKPCLSQFHYAPEAVDGEITSDEWSAISALLALLRETAHLDAVRITGVEICEVVDADEDGRAINITLTTSATADEALGLWDRVAARIDAWLPTQREPIRGIVHDDITINVRWKHPVSSV